MARSQRRRYALRLESLESRLTPAIATWDGGGADNLWSTPANWVGDVVPVATDDLAFPAGAAQLTNVNDFPSGTLFTSFSITGSGYAISGNAIMLAAGVTADIPSGLNATLALPLGGTGGLSKIGSGGLILAGANSYLGVTTVNSGSLSVRTDTALGASGAGNETMVADGASLVFDAHILNVAESISITEPATTGPNVPSLRVPGFGAVTLTGPLTVIAAADSNAAIVRGDSPGSSLTIANGVGESGGVGDIRFQTITVLFTFSSTNTLTGQTQVSDGARAFFNGQAASSPVVNVFAALIGGTGVIGPVSVGGLSGADITAADDSTVGVLTTGDFNLQARIPPVGGDGELIVNLTSSGGAASVDRINVNGSVQLGGVLILRPSAGLVLPPGGRFVILANDGSDAVMGTFRDIPEGETIPLANGNAVRVTYHGGDGNDVELQSVGVASRFSVGAGGGGGPQVNVYNADGAFIRAFFAYDAAFRGGVRVATRDLTGDGVPDVVTAPGVGGGPDIRVFDGATGAMIREFLAYNAAFTGGVFVATGDVNGDGTADIVTGAGAGGGPHVKVFDGRNGDVIVQFMAYDIAFPGGVSVAAGDTTGDGKADIITGAGPGGGPHVRVFDGTTGLNVANIIAYDPSFRGGVNVAALPGVLGATAIVTAPGTGGGPDVRVFVNQFADVARFAAYDPAFRGGVSVGVAPIGPNGEFAILTGAGPGGGPHVKAFTNTTVGPPEVELSFFAFDPAFTGGIYVG